MRFTSVWTTASTEPTTMLRTASTQTMGFQSSCSVPKAEKKMRSRAAKPAALAAAAMNAVTGVGEPWYTSGVHVWNGTAATLKPKPPSRRARPARRAPLLGAVGRVRRPVGRGGRPRVERDRRDLEAEADEQESETGEEDTVAEGDVLAQPRRD